MFYSYTYIVVLSQISYSSHYALTQPPPKMSDDDSDINSDYNDGYEHGYSHGYYDGYYSDANGPDDEQSSEYSESDDSSGSESEFESESESEAESVPGSSESEAESEAESDRKYQYKYKYKYKPCSKCVNHSGSDTDDPGSDDPGYEEISRPVLSRPNQWKTPQSPNFSFSAFPDKNFYPADPPPPLVKKVWVFTRFLCLSWQQTLVVVFVLTTNPRCRVCPDNKPSLLCFCSK